MANSHTEIIIQNYTKLNSKNAIAQNIKHTLTLTLTLSHTTKYTYMSHCVCFYVLFCVPLKLAYLFLFFSSFEGCTRQLLFGCFHFILFALHTSIFLLHLENRRGVNCNSGPRSGSGTRKQSVAWWPSLRIRNGTRARSIQIYIYIYMNIYIYIFLLSVDLPLQCAECNKMY